MERIVSLLGCELKSCCQNHPSHPLQFFMFFRIFIFSWDSVSEKELDCRTHNLIFERLTGSEFDLFLWMLPVHMLIGRILRESSYEIHLLK
jgi:hypothetical protein